jgi:hypothetical protein
LKGKCKPKKNKEYPLDSSICNHYFHMIRAMSSISSQITTRTDIQAKHRTFEPCQNLVHSK